jgi:hypothetical protein
MYHLVDVQGRRGSMEGFSRAMGLEFMILTLEYINSSSPSSPSSWNL